MSKHTPEPWNDETHYRSFQTTGNIITSIVRTMSDADHERACACVAACKGVDDPAGEVAALREAVNMLGEALRQQMKYGTHSVATKSKRTSEIVDQALNQRADGSQQTKP